jgi:aspartate kinase
VQREDFAIFAGIAGKRGFSLLLVEKDEPGNSPALLQQVFCAVNSCSLRFDYLPTGLNNICLLAETAALAPVLGRLQQQIDAIEIPHHFSVQQHIALLILVGYGVRHTRASVARIYEALRRAEIGVHILNQGSGELSTWVGVDEADLENAIRAIYAEFSAVSHLAKQA